MGKVHVTYFIQKDFQAVITILCPIKD